MGGDPQLPPTDDRLADSDVEGLIGEEPDRVPDEERVVPEDVNEYVPDTDAEDYESG